MITVKRAADYADMFRTYKVLLDGNIVGKLKRGQAVTFEVTPGSHQLYIKIDWCRSNIVTFDAAGGSLTFECGNNLKGMRWLFAIVYITFLRNRYLWLTHF